MNFYVAMKDLGQMTWNSAYSQCPKYIFCDNIKGSFPTIDQLRTIYTNKSQLNTLLSANNGTKLKSDYYWSTNGGGTYNGYYYVDMSNGIVNQILYDTSYYVRPILTSW